MQSTKTENKGQQMKKKMNTSASSIDSVHSHIRNDKHTNKQPLSEITDTTTCIDEKLYYAIQPIQPQLAGKITAMLKGGFSKRRLTKLLDDSLALQSKIDEAIVVLKHHQSKLYKLYKKNNSDSIRNICTASAASTDIDSVSVITSASSSNCNIPINYLSSSSSNQSFASSVTAKLESLSNLGKIQKLDTIASSRELSLEIETKSNIKTDDIFTMPSICTVRTVRIVINGPISKSMFHLLVQKQCIPNPTAQCFQKIYVRCHKSYYHKYISGTVVYTHFVNFEEQKYKQCVDKLFDFRSDTKTNIIDLLGNTFGQIYCIDCRIGPFFGVKQYPMIQVPVEYLSKMVRICLRCKLNEAETRKRVCKYCIADEINDRKKIADYYNNKNNKADVKPYEEIERDLIKLKIEAYLIPLPMYKSFCKNQEEKGVCKRKSCTFAHKGTNEKHFGWKLGKISKEANHKRYATVMSQYELGSYQTIGLRFKYRRIIATFYGNKKHFNELQQGSGRILDNEFNRKVIVEYLNKCKVKLHLIPLVYKSMCREDNCQFYKENRCTFIHYANDRIFGDMLWKIKCAAKDSFETESVHSIQDEKQLLFDGDIEEKKTENEWKARSPIDREWGYAIRPYLDAVSDEREAEMKELGEWSINDANIVVKLETKCTSAGKRVYELFVIFEDDKDAKIKPFRTFINFSFSCEYDVGLRDANTPIDQQQKAQKKQRKPNQCPACFFNVCNDNSHWELENNRMVLAPIEDGVEDTLYGVVVQKLKSINPKKKRYKVKIGKSNITQWLKFAIVASNRFNKKTHRKDFEMVHISYAPSGVYEKIARVLEDLDKNRTERTNISKIIFGIQNAMPQKTNDYNATPAMISQLYPELNKSQVSALCGALNDDLHVFQGPPATGKTNTSSHIVISWWALPLKQNTDEKVKIHGIVPTNKGCLVLAQQCMEMSRRMNVIGAKNNNKQFKVLYFAGKTYLTDRRTKDDCKENMNDDALLEQICVNIMAEKQLRQVNGYRDMAKHEKTSWIEQYIRKELKTADCIITTFGNALNKLLKPIHFTHCLCDESNQGSLDTFLGIIRGKDLKHLCMAGDIQQLAPVTKSDNELAKKSVYEDIISYLTNKTGKVNAYYTRLNKQYRSHPQIYEITTRFFYDDSVDTPECMYDERAYGDSNYGELIVNKNNHIEWCTYGQTQLDTSSINQSKCNKKEAQIAVKYIRRFILELGNKEEHLAVISDYRAQIEEIKRLLRCIRGINVDKILLCTTNEIEGSSKPVVIYMCCRSNNTGSIGFLTDTRRANVALSRAEKVQIIIGDPNTLQYNPIYNKIFAYHKRQGAVVCENENFKFANNCWAKNNNSNWTKQVIPNIPLINISKHSEMKKRNDYHFCSGCGDIQLEKLFCGRSCSNMDLCANCMNKYLAKYCKAAKKLSVGYKNIIPVTVIDKSTFFAADSSCGISLEFDILLGKYLIENDLIKFNREDELTNRLCNVATKLCGNICKRNQKYIPQCFRILVQKWTESAIEFEQLQCSECDKALGIMRCKRNHLLQQEIMDMRFFQMMNKIRYNNKELKKYYNAGNQYTFYSYKEFEQCQQTTIVVAYLQCCGYSTYISNRLRTRVGKELFEKNKKNKGRYDKRTVIKMDKIKIDKFAKELQSQSQSHGIRNVLSDNAIKSMQNWCCYIIKLMQNAMIIDTMSGYYRHLTHTNAINAEISFGDKLTQAGLGFIAENQLKEMGFRETPDYYLKKPWIINYNNKRVEITWLDFKNTYCSATEWNIDKLNTQAIKYNRRFGPGAFIFSLGFVKPPKGLSLNCYGLLGAVPLSKDYVDKFIQQRISGRMNN